jgi:hypothetical protein
MPLPEPCFSAEIIVGAVSNRVAVQGTRTWTPDGNRTIRSAAPRTPAAPKPPREPKPKPPRKRKDHNRVYGAGRAGAGGRRRDGAARGQAYRVISVSIPVGELVALDAFAARVQMERSHLLRQAYKHFAVKVLGEDGAAALAKLGGYP